MPIPPHLDGRALTIRTLRLYAIQTLHNHETPPEEEEDDTLALEAEMRVVTGRLVIDNQEVDLQDGVPVAVQHPVPHTIPHQNTKMDADARRDHDLVHVIGRIPHLVNARTLHDPHPPLPGVKRNQSPSL